MPGFLGVQNSGKFTIDAKSDGSLIIKSICFDGLWLQVRTINKFMDDKLFFEDESIICIIEGVIFNRKVLAEKYKSYKFDELIKTLYKENGETFFTCFRGSFSGLLFDKNKKQLIIFTDHLGDKAIFYTQVGNQLYFGSEQKYISELLIENKIEFT